MSEIENILLRDLYKDLPEVPVVERQGLGAMTGRGTVTTQQDTQQRDISPAQSSVAEYMKKIIQKQIQDGASISAAAQDVPFDPAIDNMETLSARGYDSDDVLRSSVATGAVSATKQKNVRRDVMEQAERMIQEMQKERTPVRKQEIQDYLTGVDIDKAQGNLEDSVLETISGILGVPVPPKDTTTEDDSVTIEDAPDADVVLEKPTPVKKEGLGSRPVAEEEPLTDDDMGLPDDPVDRDSNFSDTVELLYSDFTEGGQEGTEAHIGQDSQNITLPAGIVADGLIYDGKTVTQGKNSILSKDFDPSKLDTTGAYKIVGGKKIKRSDYSSDVDFSKAVLSAFEDVAKTAAGSSWDSIKEGAKKAVVKIGWNKGPNWLKGNTAKSLYKELSKESPNASSLYSKVLTGSTVKSGGASIGIAKARADSFNSIASLLGVNDITKVTADNTGKNTKFNYYDSEDNLLHTEQTSRSVDIYENGNTEVVQKNSAGKW